MPKLPDTRAPALRPRPAPARPATGSGVRWLLTASLIATLGACANYSGIDPSARAVDAPRLNPTNQNYLSNRHSKLNLTHQQLFPLQPDFHRSSVRA